MSVLPGCGFGFLRDVQAVADGDNGVKIATAQEATFPADGSCPEFLNSCLLLQLSGGEHISALSTLPRRTIPRSSFGATGKPPRRKAVPYAPIRPQMSEMRPVGIQIVTFRYNGQRPRSSLGGQTRDESGEDAVKGRRPLKCAEDHSNVKYNYMYNS